VKGARGGIEQERERERERKRETQEGKREVEVSCASSRTHARCAAIVKSSYKIL